MKKLLLYILLVGAVVWFAGFLAFNYRINSYRPDEKTRTDAIIALTGGKNRIAEAADETRAGRQDVHLRRAERHFT